MEIRIDAPDLARFLAQLRGFEAAFMSHLTRADHESRRTIVKTMRASMESGSWAPNAEAYRRWKTAHGFDLRPLLRTHLLKDSVAGERVSFSPALIHSRVGWPGSLRYSGQGIGIQRGKRKGARGGSDPDLQTVARWLEEGQPGPPRPFISKTRRDVGLLVVQQFRQALARSIAGIGGAR